MSDQTGIEWADSTFNPWMGCTKVSPACDHCYAERDTRRFGRVEWGAGKPRVRTSAANWKQVERWNAKPFYACTNCGWRGDKPALAFNDEPLCWSFCAEPSTLKAARRRVFCASLADWLDNEVSIEWLVDLLDLIRRTPNLDWLQLTKRIGNWRARLDSVLHAIGSREEMPALWDWTAHWLDGNAPTNVWLGATVVNQAEADRDVPKLLAVPARVRFLSIEPMLGAINLETPRPGPDMYQGGGASICQPWLIQSGIHWIIAGGESGPRARPSHPDWYRSLRDQCAAAGAPFLFKQWGEWAPISQVPEQTIDGTYRSNRKAEEHEDQGAVDEIYGRTCTVESTCIWLDGSTRPIVSPLSFLQGKGGMSSFRIGKKAAGRKLDGREHTEFPVVRP